jgi:AcrR family transcriptional regulator
MPATTPRARARARTMEDIVSIGREHLALHGAAALSLRAVARDLGVVSSAIYRYVRSRDELLTLLVVDGYTELGDVVDAALAAAPADPRAKFLALGRAVREWALAEPARYGLLFGSPVPGYEAPAEQTVVPGTRVIVALLNVVEEAAQAGLLAAPAEDPVLPPPLRADTARIAAEFGLRMPPWALARALPVWSALFGAVSFDIFDMYGADTFTDRSAVFEYQLDTLCGLLGFAGAPTG